MMCARAPFILHAMIRHWHSFHTHFTSLEQMLPYGCAVNAIICTHVLCVCVCVCVWTWLLCFVSTFLTPSQPASHCRFQLLLSLFSESRAQIGRPRARHVIARAVVVQALRVCHQQCACVCVCVCARLSLWCQLSVRGTDGFSVVSFLTSLCQCSPTLDAFSLMKLWLGCNSATLHSN